MSHEYFKQAELALAAYANLVTGVNVKNELEIAGLPGIQADNFILNYSIEKQYNDTLTGLSATVFKSTDVNNPQTYLAIRGTDDLIDLATNLINVGILGSTSLQPQYASLKTKLFD